ncbi:NAD(P)/FAD-dependent oxidoreductase [Fodinibius halophilus]|uniref:FAD-dependent oxidoreductase n=1 Tax=Fodinibius halophilus TaxID=1736908 RepID=A0A6M1TEP4_9BACT|nr:FAD-dependent oxidoreductase [Fodinibius halophilus]NGP89204.1 FAD-dependent oxidoreductase [Fodinibius halophilus]
MKDSKDVLIIGAGIAGISVAYYLNKAGVDVTILDKGDGKDNCSYGNAGMIVPSHIIPLASPGIIKKGLRWMLSAESPFYIRPRLSRDLLEWGWKFKKASTTRHVEEAAPLLRDLLLKNRELLIELEQQEDLDFDFRKNGLFMFCNTEKGLEEEAEVARKARKLGIPAEILTAEEAREMQPDLDLDIMGATYFPKDAHLHPGSLMDGLKRTIELKGVRFEYNCEVRSFVNHKGDVEGVKTADGRVFRGSDVVIATGAWAPTLCKALNVKIPMQAGKGYSITLKDPKVLPKNCGIFSEAKVTMTPMNRSLRFAGTMEITGTNTSITPKKITGLKKSVCRYLPEYEMSDLDTDDIWVGLRPISPDGLPYVGAFHGYKNVYTSTGYAMMGMSLGAVCGKTVADLIMGKKADLVHPLTDPNRFE